MDSIHSEFYKAVNIIVPALATAVLVMATPVSPLLGAIVLAGFYAGLLGMNAISNNSPRPQTA
jgi:hypothetical protein